MLLEHINTNTSSLINQNNRNSKPSFKIVNPFGNGIRLQPPIETKFKAAKSHKTNQEVLFLLSLDSTKGVRWNVASNPNASKYTLWCLGSDLQDVRWNVASNIRTPKEKLLDLMNKDEDFQVRYLAEATLSI